MRIVLSATYLCCAGTCDYAFQIHAANGYLIDQFLQSCRYPSYSRSIRILIALGLRVVINDYGLDLTYRRLAGWLALACHWDPSIKLLCITGIHNLQLVAYHLGFSSSLGFP